MNLSGKNIGAYLTVMLWFIVAAYGCNSNTSAPKKDVLVNVVKTQSPANIIIKRVICPLPGGACCKGTPTRSKFLLGKKP